MILLRFNDFVLKDTEKRKELQIAIEILQKHDVFTYLREFADYSSSVEGVNLNALPVIFGKHQGAVFILEKLETILLGESEKIAPMFKSSYGVTDGKPK